MSDNRFNSITAPAGSEGGDDAHAWLRQLGARAHQLRSAARAADHFNAQDTPEDHDTASWLMSSALTLSAELAADIDSLARSQKERPADAGSQQRLAGLRIRAHQLHATARAADHFLDLDTLDGRDTGSWLIASALALAHKLAGEIDDSTLAGSRRPGAEKLVTDVPDGAMPRRVSATAASPMRGAA